jgi:hypothetical protein
VKLRFQADADLNEDIVKGVIRREPESIFAPPRPQVFAD